MVNKVKMWEETDQNINVLVHLHIQHANPHMVEGENLEGHLDICNQELLQVSLIIHQGKKLINLVKICCKWLYSNNRLY